MIKKIKQSGIPAIHIALSLLCISLLTPSLALANGGTILTSQMDNKHYVLLVQSHKNNYFEFPGGQSEKVSSMIEPKKKTESDFETALRETVEETRGYLGRQLLLKTASGLKRIKKGKFSLYPITVPFFELDEIRRIKLPNKKKWAPMLEVADYAWVDVKLIEQNNSRQVMTRAGKKIYLHAVVNSAIKTALRKNFFKY